MLPNLIASTREHSDHEALKYPTPERFATSQQLKSGPKFRASSAVTHRKISVQISIIMILHKVTSIMLA